QTRALAVNGPDLEPTSERASGARFPRLYGGADTKNARAVGAFNNSATGLMRVIRVQRAALPASRAGYESQDRPVAIRHGRQGVKGHVSPTPDPRTAEI